MTEPTTWFPGQDVKVSDANARHMDGPYDGVVKSVGRKYIYVTYPGTSYADREKGARFHPDGRRADKYGHQHVYTPEQWAERERIHFVQKALANLGISFRLGVSFPVETLEAIACAADPEFMPKGSHSLVAVPDNRKIQTIKAIREITRLGLRDSKDIVDHVSAGGVWPFPVDPPRIAWSDGAHVPVGVWSPWEIRERLEREGCTVRYA